MVSSTSLETKHQEPVTEQDGPCKKEPTPIPNTNFWNLKRQSEASVNNKNNTLWPEPKEAVQQEQVNEKTPIKSIGRGQWKPFTPTIIHSMPINSRRNNNRQGNSNKKSSTKPSKTAYTHKDDGSALKDNHKTSNKPNPTTTTPLIESNQQQRRQHSNERGRGRGRGVGYRYPHFSTRPNPSAYLNLDPKTLESYICQQIEYYFSIDNLCKDLYLRSQMNSEGYVPLTLIAGFNRVRGLTDDISLVRASLEHSEVLEYIKEQDILRKKEGWETWVLPATGTTTNIGFRVQSV